VIRQNQMAAIGDEQAALHLNRQGLLDRLRFLDERERIENHSTTDNARHFRLKNSGRDQVQDVAAIPKTDRVACIVTALVSGDAVESFRQDIDDLTLSFVTPLDADDCEILFH